MMRVIEIEETSPVCGIYKFIAMVSSEGKKTRVHFGEDLQLSPGDRLVVVPAGEPLPGDEIERLKDVVHELEEMVTAEQERANGNGGDAYRYLGENNILAANIRELEEEIERLSAELREAKAQPTVKELCRAYRDWLVRAKRVFVSTALEILPDGDGWIKKETGDSETMLKWCEADNPVAVIDAACRPEPQPVAPQELTINFGTMSPELTAEVKQFLSERGIGK